MKIAVFGAGGVGGYFGGRLAQAGEQVIFIARGDHLRAMQTEGLQVDSIQGDFQVQPVQATDDPGEVGPVDVVLVAVKAWQVPHAAETIRPMVAADTIVVPLENGVEAPDQLAAVLGEEHVLGGLCHISAYIVEPGHIRHAGLEPDIYFGELDGRRSERAERLLQAFQRAGVKAQIPDNIQTTMWEKFLFIASFSGVGAVTRAPVGVLRSLEPTRELLEEAMQEIVSVAVAREVALPEDVIENTMAFIDRFAPGVTASMQRDIIEGKPSELESQNGAVVRMAYEASVPVPVHTFLYQSLLPQELRARGEVDF